MKKMLLAFLLIAFFALYAVSARAHGGDLLLLPLPAGRDPGFTPAGMVQPSVAAIAPTAAPGLVSVAAGEPSATPAPAESTPVAAVGQYRDGTYVGQSADAFYGLVQVQAVVSNGAVSDVAFLDYPHTHGTSVSINSYAAPMLVQEAISAQGADVDVVSGATLTSLAFRQSLESALVRAKA